MKETEKNNERLEVGEYVRLERSQGIRKIIEIDDEREGVYILDREILNEYGDDAGEITIEDVKKHSKNICNILEKDDRVLMEYYITKERDKVRERDWFDVYEWNFKGEDLVEFKSKDNFCTYDLTQQKFACDDIPEIQEVVPWEQFNRVRYEIR